MPSPDMLALRRSLRIYHGDKARNERMDALYARFLAPGDLAFDIGAHVGDRVSSFRRLGCRVIALEPQPLLVRALRLIHGRDPQVTILQAAAGARPGTLELHVNTENPTVSTASREFIAAAAGSSGWEDQRWDRTIAVEMTTLDALIARFGPPRFVKIDVEGFEADVLAGSSDALPALSFEFTTIQRDVACRCLDRLAQLGDYRFNLALGESQQLAFETPIPGEQMAAHILALSHEANSGDVYAVLQHVRSNP